jgi:hypothetical protein
MIIMRAQGFHPRQCTAHSKRTGERCRNYALKDRSVCKFHGGRSRRGVDHPNFRHGLRVKNTPGLALARLLNRPIVVRVMVFPRPLYEIASEIRVPHRTLETLASPSESLTHDQWVRALRTARRYMAEELRELREAENGDQG